MTRSEAQVAGGQSTEGEAFFEQLISEYDADNLQEAQEDVKSMRSYTLKNGEKATSQEYVLHLQ